MSGARYRAWRFLYPDLDAPEALAGLDLSPGGGVAMAEGDAAVRQSILLLLSTAPGERVMRPDYGCDLGQLLFAPNDDTTAGLAIHFVRRALQRWEPRVEILSLDAVPNPEDPARLDIQLEYRVRSTQHSNRLSLPIQLQGERADAAAESG